MSIEVEDDIEADVRAALGGNEGVQDQPLAGQEPAPVVAEPAAEGQVRAADGKFAKAPEAVQDATQESAPVVPEQPEPATVDIRAPNAWTASAKALFNDLPPLAREEIARRELDMAKGVQKLQAQISQYAPLEEVLAPHKDELAMQGVDTVTFMRQLVAAHGALRSNPTQALQYLAQQYGGQLPTMDAPQQADPNQAVYEKIQTLEAKLAGYETAQQQQAQSELQSQITKFQDDPANLYFENVKPHMAALLANGQVETLQDAYDQACWANPEVRGLMLKAEQAKMANVTQLRTNNARAAAGSVTGGAQGIATPQPSGNSYEDDVRAAVNQLGGRA